MGSYNSINFLKLIVEGIPYNKAYMGSKILFENANPFTLEITGETHAKMNISSGQGYTLYITTSHGTFIHQSNSSSSETAIGYDATFNTYFEVGEKIHLKVVYNNLDNTKAGVIIRFTQPFKVYGDILTYSSDNYCRSMFNAGNSGTTRNQNVDISGLIFADTTDTRCYQEMFFRCNFVNTETVTLPATTLNTRCYQSMFAYTNISDITINASEFSTEDYVCYYMLNGTSTQAGILHLPDNNNYPSTNTSWLPTNWTIQTIQEEPEFDYSAEYLTFKNVSEDNDIWVYWKHEWDSVEEDEYGLDPDDYNLLIQYSFDKETWVYLSAGPDTENNTYNRFELRHGQTVYIKGNKYRYMISGEEDDYYGYFEFTKQYQSDELLVEVSGNIMSMVAGDNFQEAEFVNNGSLASLFKRNTDIVSAENLIIPANNTQGCFTFLFSDCSNMVKGPKITATDTPAQYAYNGMFYRCSSLTSISIDSPYTSGCYNNWMYNASASGTIYYTDDSWQNAPTGTSGIPSGWTATKVS